MRWKNRVVIGFWAAINIGSSSACEGADDGEAIGAEVAELDLGASDDAARVSDVMNEGVSDEALADEASAPARAGEVPVLDLVNESGAVFGPPGKCCYVRCGAQLTYQKLPWQVEGSCDKAGWEFCAKFYVTKLADAAWLPC